MDLSWYPFHFNTVIQKEVYPTFRIHNLILSIIQLGNQIPERGQFSFTLCRLRTVRKTGVFKNGLLSIIRCKYRPSLTCYDWQRRYTIYSVIWSDKITLLSAVIREKFENTRELDKLRRGEMMKHLENSRLFRRTSKYNVLITLSTDQKVLGESRDASLPLSLIALRIQLPARLCANNLSPLPQNTDKSKLGPRSTHHTPTNCI